MRTNYILIDLENIQPKNLKVLKDHDFKVVVFVGSKQTKISFDLAIAMQSLGESAEYVKIDGDGHNALDFHIAFYIGQLSETNSNCYFHIISKDTGFDPLIKHLKTKNIYVQREKDISEIPLLKPSYTKSIGERLNAIVDHLKSRGNAKPRTVVTLSNSINSLFQQKIGEVELANLVEELVKRKVVVKNGNKVSYDIPEIKVQTG